MAIVNLSNAEHYTWGNGSDGWHLLDTEGLSVIQERVSAGESEVRHYHNHSQQYFHILSGEACLELSGSVYTIGRGEGIHVPAKEPHKLLNSSNEELIFLVISQPKSHGDRVVV